MSSAMLSLLVSHILTFLEHELLKQEPQLVAILEQDIKSLVAKLEALIQNKSPAAEAVVAPILNAVTAVATSALDATGNALVQSVG